jgi:branched-chain amino acid transport system permease protein
MINWSISENELLAQHIGINVFKHKVIAFTVACMCAAVTGALYAHYQTFISPKSFDIWKSEFALVHIIVGGLSTVGGPVVGAISLTMIDETLRATGHFRVILFGVILIATVLILPGGLETIPQRVRNAFGRSK